MSFLFFLLHLFKAKSFYAYKPTALIMFLYSSDIQWLKSLRPLSYSNCMSLFLLCCLFLNVSYVSLIPTLRPQYFKIIEECVSQIVLHRSGTDPDFSYRKRLDVDFSHLLGKSHIYQFIWIIDVWIKPRSFSFWFLVFRGVCREISNWWVWTKSFRTGTEGK